MEKEAKQVSKNEVISESLRKTNYLISKNKVEEIELYEVSKEFFKKYLDIDYEATSNELINIINKTYIPEGLDKDMKQYLEALSVVEYKDSSLTDEKINLMLTYLQAILKKLDSSGKKKKGFWKKLFGKK